jgi:hypothetical protein
VAVGQSTFHLRTGAALQEEPARRQLLLERLAQLERGAATQSGTLQRLFLALRCAHNDVEPAAQSGTRWALFVRGSGRPGEAALLTANHFRSSVLDFTTVYLQIVERCLVTGNLIGNQAAGQGDSQPASLSLYAPSDTKIKLVTVTGNVFQGQARDLSRNDYPAPLDSWLPFNTQV